jgi:hypothetical protein
MGNGVLRLRAVIVSNLETVVVVLVVLTAFGGWVTYTTYVEPGTTTETRTVGSWETTAQFDHRANVTEDNPAFPVGTTLSNRRVYFTNVAPRLNGTFVFSHSATGNTALTETVTVALVTRGIEGSQTDQNVLWTTSDALAKTTTDVSGPEKTVRVPFSVHVPTIENRTRRIETELGGGAGQTEVLVRATVDLQGTINGQPVSRTETYALPIAPEGTRYRIEDFGERTDTHETTRRVTVERTYGPLRRFGGPALLGTAILALGAVLATRATDRLEPDGDELERLAFEDDRAEFDEWISAIRLPDEAFDRPVAEAESLGDLVDLAIDTDSAVVEDPHYDAFYVVHGDFLYRYRPPTESGRVSFGPRGREFDMRLGDRDEPADSTDGESPDLFGSDSDSGGDEVTTTDETDPDESDDGGP